MSANEQNRTTEAVVRPNFIGEIDLDAYDIAQIPRELIPTDDDPTLGVALRKSAYAVWIALPSIDRDAIRYWRRSGLDTHWIEASRSSVARLRGRLHASMRRADEQAGDESVDSPIADWVNETLDRAIDQHASDVHFEPYERHFRVRARIDGVLHTLVQPNVTLMTPAIARLKVMAGLDTAERRLPQDGRAAHRRGDRSHDLRVSTLPTMYGEKVVARILAQNTEPLALEQLGLFRPQREGFTNALTRPQGMILVTGPTGSGKTATLYAALHYLNELGRNLATVEDPIEIQVDGINQVQVDERIGMTFATALRALLRQDPDVLMVGEVRDAETADVAVKAAQTGHLVLATLHSNSAADAVGRLRGLGIGETDIDECVMLVIAQRLVRLLCPHCKVRARSAASATADPTLLDAPLDAPYRANPEGCSNCLSGYRHRRGIYEILRTTPTGRSDRDADPLRAMRESGLARVRRGETSMAELERVIGLD